MWFRRKSFGICHSNFTTINKIHEIFRVNIKHTKNMLSREQFVNRFKIHIMNSWFHDLIICQIIFQSFLWKLINFSLDLLKFNVLYVSSVPVTYLIAINESNIDVLNVFCFPFSADTYFFDNFYHFKTLITVIPLMLVLMAAKWSIKHEAIEVKFAYCLN